jgi:hypothetical protein
VAQQHKHKAQRTGHHLYAALRAAPLTEKLSFFPFSFKKCLFMYTSNPQNKNQQPTPKVYIVTKSHCAMVGSEELKLINVRPEDEAAFLKEYEGRILVSADNVQEAFIKFNEYKKGQ